MEKEELLDRYEATGDDAFYGQAKPLYEEALAARPDDARLLWEYGYLEECYGRFAIRTATSSYERAIQLAPDWDKPRYQLTAAQAVLGETDRAIALYKERLAGAPDEPREYRFLAAAYRSAYEYEEAEKVLAAALELWPDDAQLLTQQGDVYAALDRPEEALASLERVFELDADLVDARYSAAFLHEREGRLREAADTWRFLIGWLRHHGYAVQAEWPERELARLEARLEAAEG